MQKLGAPSNTIIHPDIQKLVLYRHTWTLPTESHSANTAAVMVIVLPSQLKVRLKLTMYLLPVMEMLMTQLHTVCCHNTTCSRCSFPQTTSYSSVSNDVIDSWSTRFRVLRLSGSHWFSSSNWKPADTCTLHIATSSFQQMIMPNYAMRVHFQMPVCPCALNTQISYSRAVTALYAGGQPTSV